MFDSLNYNKKTGLIRWRNGGIAGTLTTSGYLRIQVGYRQHAAHKIAWYLVTGHYPVFPKEHIDHLNGVRTDNRWNNLRLVSSRENQQNQQRHRNGKLVGACFDKSRGKWISYKKINGKRIFLGRFASESEAHQAYRRLK